MSWQVLIAISIVTYSFSVLLQRILLKHDKTDPLAFVVFFQAVTGVFIGATGFLLGELRLPSVQSLLSPFFLGMIVLYGGGSILKYCGFKHVEASLVSILSSTSVLFTILVLTIFLREGLTTQQFVGTLLILVSIVVIHLNTKKLRVGKYELLVLGAAFAYGIQITNDRFLLQSFELYAYVSLAFLCPAAAIATVYRHHMKHMKVFFERLMLKKMLLLCVLYGVAAVTFYIALKVAPNSSQVASLDVVGVVVTVILAIVLLREREHLWQKLVGAVLSTVGLFLVG